MGRQIMSHSRGAASIRFAEARRFKKSESLGPGPATITQTSSFGKQLVSTKRGTGACTFGTSTREHALRLYAIYTCKK